MQEVDACRTEDEEASVWSFGPAPLIHQAAQHLEKAWHPLNFIENDQFVLVESEEQLGFGEFGEVGWRFEIEVKGGSVFCNGERQGGLAHLTRPEKPDDRMAGKQAGETELQKAGIHTLQLFHELEELQG